MLRRLDLRGVTGDLRSVLPRPHAAVEPPIADVQAILADVEARGDDALREYTARFDGVPVEELRVPPEQVKAALDEIPDVLRAALEVARDNIE
jgi:histidinol dehydrogenase